MKEINMNYDEVRFSINFPVENIKLIIEKMKETDPNIKFRNLNGHEIFDLRSGLDGVVVARSIYIERKV